MGVQRKILIINKNGSNENYFRQIFELRELVFFFVLKDILVRYKQTIFGVLWALFNPVMTIIVFTFIFGKLANLSSNGLPYALIVFAAVLPWQLFSSTIHATSNSIVGNSGLVSKVYFPRMILPLSVTGLLLIDFFIALILFFIVAIYFRVAFSFTIFFLPFFLLLLLLVALGLGLILSAAYVKYRDVKYVAPYIIQFGLFISPVGYLSSIVPDKWFVLYSLNPLVGIIDGFRWCLFSGATKLSVWATIVALVFSVSVFIIGVIYFRRMEKDFIDVI